MGWSDRLGTVGVWHRVGGLDAGVVVQIEDLGYRTLWLGGSPGADLGAAERFLDATASLTVATGVVNIWRSGAEELADSFQRIERRHPGRLLLGIGSGHREATPQRERPLDAMARYVDVLDAHGVPADRRVLSALGPRMLALAGERSAGTHPYLTIPPQTAQARAALGPAALVAPEQTVVLGTEVEAARRDARDFLRSYLGMVNYVSTMRRGGFSESDVADGGSDRLVDAIVRHGDGAALATAVREHLDAGADHVCVQVVPAAGDVLPALRAIAERLGL
ncbi:MAG: LLM class F420-dependent oxidoreductase [Cellulomonas sp. 73-145]|uniref:TIGR03620 family F420-dependent LLM class oxidoreductase n=1 Tax=Cellulomonas sp. 73-145 TaxID=1895739 RepID=UPI000929F83C|nr:TIGR03620 family F420-dependent LLM class oxidoreductase [Cellulomonas sp. 73-145]OJV60412.1 MAG: LLM class F420-dependent oxidoreductase [Cellulomonas sp. 73-145]